MKNNLIKSLFHKASYSYEILKSFPVETKKARMVRKVLKMLTPQGTFCLKKIEGSQGRLAFIEEVFKHLQQEKFPHYPQVKAGKKGEIFIKDQNRAYLLTEWINGGECNFSDPNDLRGAIRVLAKLHLVSKGFKTPPVSASRVSLGTWGELFGQKVKDFETLTQRIKKVGARNEFEKIFQEYAEQFITDAQKAIYIVSTSRYRKLTKRPKGSAALCHSDVADNNFIKSRDGEVFLIDFDNCRWDHRAKDLGMLLYRGLEKRQWDPRFLEKVLETYNEVNKLYKDELELILAQILFPQRIWRITERYIKGYPKWTKKDFSREIQNCVKYADERSRLIEYFSKKIKVRLLHK